MHRYAEIPAAMRLMRKIEVMQLNRKKAIYMIHTHIDIQTYFFISSQKRQKERDMLFFYV